MICPLCGSTDIAVECCGSTAAFCRSCGLRWDTGVPAPCQATKPEVSFEDAVKIELPSKEVPPISDYQLWGQ